MKPLRFCIIIYLLFINLPDSFAQSNSTKLFVKVDGDITKLLTLSANDQAKTKRTTVSIKDHDGKVYNYTGVAIQEILEQAGYYG